MRARQSGASHQRAQDIVTKVLTEKGWRVSPVEPDQTGPDLIARRGHLSYAVELKAAPEGRADRLTALWAQACLQASRAAAGKYVPLAIVAAPQISERAASTVLKFAAENAPEAAVGVIDFRGFRLFRGPELQGLDSEETEAPLETREISKNPADLFSDLNQWMLKVLLAPELPDNLLSAPRGRYRGPSQLARAAKVSVMSASRLIQQLRHDGFIKEQHSYLKLVRREELFERWRASALRQAKELPLVFMLRGDPYMELRRMLRKGHACLGLFAAADALGFGFVRGVPPHVLVEHLNSASLRPWKNVAPAGEGEMPDLILRKALAPQSVFRGIVRANDMPVSDILQVWLDVSSHPSRGKEQGAIISKKVLAPILRGEGAGG